jgi:sec-independent protein translocase protein TatA
VAVFAPTPIEIIIVLIIVLIIFGPKRLPDLWRSLGRGMREFKDSVTGKDKDELPEADSQERQDKPHAQEQQDKPQAAASTAGEQEPAATTAGEQKP